MNNLSYYAYYINEKIDVSKLNLHNYIGVDNMIPDRGGVVDSEYLPASGKAVEFKKGDILIGNIRPYFKKIWLASFDGGCSPDVLCLRTNDKLSAECLYAILSQDLFFDYDMSGSTGSKMPRGDKDHIMRFPIVVPENKDSIGRFIVSINNKITLNNERSLYLQQIIESYYTRWFLQYDFPVSDGPYKAKNHPMVFNEKLKKDIPLGWKVVNIRELCELIWGQCPDGKNILPLTTSLNGTMLYCSGAGDMRNGIVVDCQARTNDSKKEAESGDILMSVAGSIGALVVCDKRISLGRAAVAFRTKPNNRAFCFFTIKKYLDRIKTISNGSIQKVFSDDHIDDISFAVDEAMLKKFEFANTLFERCVLLDKENKELVRFRNEMLTMLVNGQISIKNG